MDAPVRLVPGARVLALDVGGTDIKATVVDEEGRVAPVVRTPTPRPSDHIVDDILNAVASAASAITDLRTVAAVGLAVPGIVDDDRGVAAFSENLGWRDVALRDLVAARLGRPTALVHDVRASALAESTVGAAEGVDSAVVVAIGTGIAAGVVERGRLLVHGGFAGEIGHAVVRPGGRACRCGNHGCLEAEASAAAIATRYSQRSGTAVTGARDVVDRIDRDPIAAEVWDEAVDALAFGLSHVSALLAPDLIVIAGGLSEAGDTLLEPLRTKMDALTRVRTTPLARARLGGDAGVIGAALRARGRAA